MKKLFLIMILASGIIASQDLLVSNPAFSVYADSVREGNYSGIVLNSKSIKSNYLKTFSEGFDRIVKFKFSINGLDNEAVSGKDHSVYMNPKDGKFITPVFKFGEDDPVGTSLPQGEDFEIKMNHSFDVTFRLDMRSVLKELEANGKFRCFDGSVIKSEDMDAPYIFGGTTPLNWSFEADPKLRMTDKNGDGIFEITLTFENSSSRPIQNGYAFWNLSEDISEFPKISSNVKITETLYNLSLEEFKQDIRDDGALMAGKKWTGVWTRDISYSILLSLAAIAPDACKTSLMAKVDEKNRIIQDTGTGGSWPVSSDRITWILAAWEVYLTTGDEVWLKQIYPIIKNSLDVDLLSVLDKSTGLIRGESSFLDWREQTYPKWMEPKDIYKSQCLGTNAAFYQSFKILAQISKILGEPNEKYYSTAKMIKDGMNKYLLNEDGDRLSQYLYGNQFLSASDKTEALGTSLSVLFEILEPETSRKVITNYPISNFGIPSISPQISEIPPYHNNGIWPFVVGYYAWASAKTGNTFELQHSIGSIYRVAALFLTNKENFVAENGDPLGTEINSDRQLWSVAANLAIVYRIYLGMNFSGDGIKFTPNIPFDVYRNISISEFKYRNAKLVINVNGFGNEIISFKINGEESDEAFFPAENEGDYVIDIILKNNIVSDKGLIREVKFAPETPNVQLEETRLIWDKIESAENYEIFRNGKSFETVYGNSFDFGELKDYAEFQVRAVNKSGVYSFLSQPVSIIQELKFVKPAAENFLSQINGASDNKYLSLTKSDNLELNFNFEVPETGKYKVDFRYNNSNGPINTDNKCAIRSVYVNDNYSFIAVLPQRGRETIHEWGYSNSEFVNLKAGKNTITLKFEPHNENMNIETNSLLLDHLRIIKL